MKLKELLSEINIIAEDKGYSKPYLCGGVPRDHVMSNIEIVSDIDLTTGDATIKSLATDVAINYGKQFNIKTKVMNDGHQSIFFKNIKLDFSSNFNTPNIESILSKIGITDSTDLQKEMYSRDYTCNTLLMSMDLMNISDPTGKGLDAIKNKILDTCLDPEITFTVNKNRIARGICFSSKLDFELSDRVKSYIKSNPDLIKFSEESVLAKKINDAFIYNAKRAVKNITECNLWKYIPITDTVKPYYKKSI